MEGKIKVLIVDDIVTTRENICKLLEFHPEIMPVGQAAGALEAIEAAKELQPDIVLMDINMPGMDGIAAAEILAAQVPKASVIMMSVQGEQEYLRRAMVAGAKNYLTKPFTGEELVQAVQQVYETEQKRKKVVSLEPSQPQEGNVITVFSTKGGIGKTTITTNLAVAIAEQLGATVGIVDGDLQFGDVALFLNIMPHATMVDLVKDMDNLDEQALEGYLTTYSRRVKVLAAPFRPEQAETIQACQLSAILKIMRRMFDYVIVDTAPSFNEHMLSLLDAADQVLVVSAMDLPTVKNVKLCLEIMDSLHYSQDKVKVILNRADSDGGMEAKEIEETLRCRFAALLPSDGKTVMKAVNKGVPFVIGSPQAQVSKEIFQLAHLLTGSAVSSPEGEKDKGMVYKLKRLFG